jgi:excisionase family DNA binding protein
VVAGVVRLAAVVSAPRSITLAEPAAMIGGRAALVLTAVLNRRSLKRELEDIGFSEGDRAAATEAAIALAEAGESWRRSRLPQSGNAATRGNDLSLALEPMVTVDEAGVLLGLGSRRVRQLAAAGDIPAERTSRGWGFVRSDVVGFREARERERA